MSGTPSHTRFGRLSAAVAIGRDLFSLLRDMTLFLLVLLLLCFPVTFNAILSDAGFEEGSFAGWKWKHQLDDTTVVLSTAQDTISTLKDQNGKLRKALANLSSNAGSSNEKGQIEELQQQSQKALLAADQVQASVGTTLEANRSLIAGTRMASAEESPPASAYCYQEERAAPGAQQYSVHCHLTEARCEAARGPNPRTRQSPCTLVNLVGVRWHPNHPGWMGSWYEFGSTSFGEPFPAIPKR